MYLGVIYMKVKKETICANICVFGGYAIASFAAFKYDPLIGWMLWGMIWFFIGIAIHHELAR